MSSPFPVCKPDIITTNLERAGDAHITLLLDYGKPVTLEAIERLMTNLLHLAFVRNLGDVDRLLTNAQMRFIEELDAEDDG